MKNKFLIICLLMVLMFIGYNIYSVINNTIIAEQRLSTAKIDYERFKSENINYNYEDIVDFSSKYDGIMLKSIKNSKDSLLANFYFEGNLEA